LKITEDYNRAIELKPDFAVAFSNRGYLYLDLGKYQLATKDFQKSIELDSKKELPYIGLSIVSFRQKRIEEAKKYYRKAIEIEPICKDGGDSLELEKGYVFIPNQKRTINEILGIMVSDTQLTK
jgi:tetratricopeptide (TPR) repeat protein